MVRICPQILSQGVCTEEDCPHQHNIHFCHTCRVVCISEEALRSHQKGRKHRNRLRRDACDDPSFCTVCNISLSSPLAYQQHVLGMSHRIQLGRQAIQNHDTNDDTSSNTVPVPPPHVQCDICGIAVLEAIWSTHITGISHRKKERFIALQAAFDEADQNKHDITVSHEGEDGVDFGVIDADNAHTPPQTITVKIDLTTPSRIDILDIRLSSSLARRRSEPRFSLEEQSFPTRLWFHKPFLIPVTFNSRDLRGRFHDRLEIVFLDTSLYVKFAITRTLQATVGSKADLDLLKPSAPYRPREKSKQVPEGEIIPGVKPTALAEIVWTVPLPQAHIPKDLDALLQDTRVKRVVENLSKTWLPSILNSKTYGRRFRNLLFVEEAAMNIDIQRYDGEDVALEPLPDKYFRLPVPGLAENRPSVIVGDRILVQIKGSPPSGRWFEGLVHRVRQSDVDLKFNANFSSLKGQKYNVRFKVGRLPLRRMHQALFTAFVADRVLFPHEVHLRGRKEPNASQIDDIRVVNRLIATNPPQLLAVAAIMHMPPGSVPFVIFGPPGTGKTVTAVESMRQILLANPDARILSCAPSNWASDLIAERLSDNLSPSQLFRLNAPSRRKDTLPKSLEPFSRSNKEGTFSVPPLQELMKYRVIVSTCFSASVTYGIGMQRGHFTHIFIDEAGQAMEPEAMIPIKTMADSSTNIVLSGDPKQLGPIVRSAVARELGLGVSYLDRLMANDVYINAGGNGISFVKLIKNWRNHKAILKFPNVNFYRGELEPCGDKIVTHSLLRSDVLVEPEFPVVFHGITGKDMREGSSPSFFNPHEASLVKKYIELLRDDRRLRLRDEHIGVIAPYHAQSMKIKTLLKKRWSGIKVGSVEEFQGQERRVMIISTVRSSIEFVHMDIKQSLGFVANPRRFNVAVTRAQALLIVIGDPSVLSLDPLWRGFLNYIYINGGWTGKEPDWDPEEPIRADGGYDVDKREEAESEMLALIERTKEMILENTERLEPIDEYVDVRGDLPWREID